MKVFAEKQKSINFFSKVNGLNIKNNDDLQRYLEQVGLKVFMMKHHKACHTAKNFDYDFDFKLESEAEMEELQTIFIRVFSLLSA